MGVLITLSPPGLRQLWGANIYFKLTSSKDSKQTCGAFFFFLSSHLCVMMKAVTSFSLSPVPCSPFLQFKPAVSSRTCHSSGHVQNGEWVWAQRTEIGVRLT